MYDPPYVWRHTWKQQLLEATQLGSWCYRCLLHNHGLQGSSGELHQGGSGELPGQFTIRAGQNFATYELYFAYELVSTHAIGAFWCYHCLHRIHGLQGVSSELPG